MRQEVTPGIAAILAVGGALGDNEGGASPGDGYIAQAQGFRFEKALLQFRGLIPTGGAGQQGRGTEAAGSAPDAYVPKYAWAGTVDAELHAVVPFAGGRG